MRAATCPVLLGVLLAAAWGCSHSRGTVAEDPSVTALRVRGKKLFLGRAGCTACHSIGRLGGRIIGPNLGVGEGMTRPVGIRAASRRPGLTPIEYLIESILTPDAFVVPGYPAGVMKAPDEPPISLKDDEVVALATYLAGLGGRRVQAADVARARAAIPRVRRHRARLAHAPGSGAPAGR